MPTPPRPSGARSPTRFRPKLPKLAALLDEAEADVLAYMSFPKEHRAKIHSTDEIDKSLSLCRCLSLGSAATARARRGERPSTRLARRAARSGDGGGATLAVRFGLPSPDEALVGAFGLLRDRQLLMT